MLALGSESLRLARSPSAAKRPRSRDWVPRPARGGIIDVATGLAEPGVIQRHRGKLRGGQDSTVATRLAFTRFQVLPRQDQNHGDKDIASARLIRFGILPVSDHCASGDHRAPGSNATVALRLQLGLARSQKRQLRRCITRLRLTPLPELFEDRFIDHHWGSCWLALGASLLRSARRP